jgi:CBS domain-containing protein
LVTVLDILSSTRIHHIPVVNNNNNLVGIITTYDLWKLGVPFGDYGGITVESVMTTKLAKISSTDKVGTAAELFLDNRFHALPVVDQGNLVGIVTSFDILRYEFKKEYKQPILFKDIYERGLNSAVS